MNKKNLSVISKKSSFDHIVNTIKAIFSSLPFAGGIATLIEDYIPKSTENSLNNFLSDLKDHLERLEGRIEIEFLNKDEFAELFKSCYLGVVRTTQRNKIKIFSRMVANILLKEGDIEKVSYSELDHLVRAMDNLSIGALRILIIIYKHCSETKDHRFNFLNINSKIPDLDPSLIMGLISELNSTNLVHMTGVPGVRTPDYANYPIELTELGSRFVERFAF